MKTYGEPEAFVNDYKNEVDLIVNLSASPWNHVDGLNKTEERQSLFETLTEKADLIYCNAVGGQDDLIFDGRSVYVSQGKFYYLPAFEEVSVVIDADNFSKSGSASSKDIYKDIYSALVLGTRDYFRKTGFTKALIGLEWRS